MKGEEEVKVADSGKDKDVSQVDPNSAEEEEESKPSEE